MKKKEEGEEKKSFKELWKDPKSNAKIKLGFWGIFFIVLYLFAFISGAVNKNNTPSKPKENNSKITFTKMKNNLSEKEQEVIYSINNYYITGVLKDNILTATLEDDSDNIYKIKYDGENIYQLKKNEETVNEELLNDINKDYLLVDNIIEIIDDPKMIVTKSADEKVYSYNNDDYAISVYLNDKYIEKIVILEGDITYSLEYKEVASEKEV